MQVIPPFHPSRPAARGGHLINEFCSPTSKSSDQSRYVRYCARSAFPQLAVIFESITRTSALTFLGTVVYITGDPPEHNFGWSDSGHCRGHARISGDSVGTVDGPVINYLISRLCFVDGSYLVTQSSLQSLPHNNTVKIM